MAYFHPFLMLTHVWFRGTYVCLQLWTVYTPTLFILTYQACACISLR